MESLRNRCVLRRALEDDKDEEMRTYSGSEFKQLEPRTERIASGINSLLVYFFVKHVCGCDKRAKGGERRLVARAICVNTVEPLFSTTQTTDHWAAPIGQRPTDTVIIGIINCFWSECWGCSQMFAVLRVPCQDHFQ